MNDDTTLKTCRKCGKSKPATDEYFYKHKTCKDGLLGCCKQCYKQENAERYRANSETRRQSVREYQQANKELIADRKRKRHQDNPRVMRSRVAKWKRDNPEKLKAQLQRRKATKRHAEGHYTGEDLALQLRSQKGLCWWCGKPHGDNYHIDHRIPLDKGGTNWANNICISCADCNLRKNNKLPYQFNGRLL